MLPPAACTTKFNNVCSIVVGLGVGPSVLSMKILLMSLDPKKSRVVTFSYKFLPLVDVEKYAVKVLSTGLGWLLSSDKSFVIY